MSTRPATPLQRILAAFLSAACLAFVPAVATAKIVSPTDATPAAWSLPAADLPAATAAETENFLLEDADGNLYLAVYVGKNPYNGGDVYALSPLGLQDPSRDPNYWQKRYTGAGGVPSLGNISPRGYSEGRPVSAAPLEPLPPLEPSLSFMRPPAPARPAPSTQQTATPQIKVESPRVGPTPAIAVANGLSWVVKMPKGSRPHPSTYMTVTERKAHAALFNDGASRFTTKSNFEKYGIGQSDGTSFVMTRKQADELIASAGGNARAMEKSLGLPDGFLEGNQLIRVDIPNPHKAGLRIPSGNEAGANPQWLPGGVLPNGQIEGVIDVGGLKAVDYKAILLSF